MSATAISRGPRPDVSVVVPLKDEGGTLAALHQRVRECLEGIGATFEIVFVDDGSTDSSVGVLTALAHRDDRVRVFRLRRNFGKAAALSVGFAEARGRRIVTMDADLQDVPETIPRLLAKLAEGYDLVSGWKMRRQDRFVRRVASRVFNWATRKLSGLPLHDFDCGLKAYSDRCAAELASATYGDMHRFLPVIAHARGFAVTEIPVPHEPRRVGSSKYGWDRYVRALLDLLTSTFLLRFRRRPLHALGSIALALFGVAAALLVGSLLLRGFGTDLGAWPLITSAVLGVGGIQLLGTGLVAELMTAHRGAEVPYMQHVVAPDALETRPVPIRAAWADRS